MLQAVDCFLEAVEVLFGKKMEIMEPGAVEVPRLRTDCETLIAVGLSNKNWQGLTVVASSMVSFTDLVGDDSPEQVYDAMGEVMNTTAGCFAAIPEIVYKYGELTQGVPMRMGVGTAFPKADSMEAILKLGSGHFYFGLAIRPVLRLNF